jgi:predicted MPP superfamily phosphohydrolase
MVNAGEELAEIMELIDEADVDMVLFGGDIINVHHSEITEPILEVFSRLKPRDGVFMVLGNHDTGAYIKNSTIAKREDNIAGLVSKMERAHWCVLKDSTVYIYKGSDSIAVTGIDYNEELLKYKHSMDAVKGVDFSRIYNNVSDSVFNITLSHLPQLWHSIRKGEFSDLTLSGHIHAMQMKFGRFSPARFMYKEWSGLYEYNGCRLYINDGIGCVGYLARFGARPEITVIELYRK